MNPASVDDVTDALREAIGHGFHDTHQLATSVTGRAGEFYLTVDGHHYTVTIAPVGGDE